MRLASSIPGLSRQNKFKMAAYCSSPKGIPLGVERGFLMRCVLCKKARVFNEMRVV